MHGGGLVPSWAASAGPGPSTADHQTGPPSGHRNVSAQDAVLVVEQHCGEEVGHCCTCPRKDRIASLGLQDCSAIW